MEKPGPDAGGDERWPSAEAEWRNPSNWRWGLFYVAPLDSRVWVRKGDPEFGWTFNFAHRTSWVWQACILGGLLALVAARHWFG